MSNNLFVRIQNNEVTDCWDTPPPAGQDGWKAADHTELTSLFAATPPHPSEWHSPPRPVLYYPAPPQLHLALELQSSYQPQVTLSVLLLSTLITC